MSEHYDSDPLRGCGLAIVFGIVFWLVLFVIATKVWGWW